MLESSRQSRTGRRVPGFRLSLALAAIAAVSSLLVASGQASPPAGPGFPQIAPMRDHGLGDWFRRVCTMPGQEAAGCEASVVSNDDGTPLQSASPPSSAMTPALLHSGYSLPTQSASGTPIIGIVDAYDDPNIANDLNAFDTQFDLPACTTSNGCFTKVNETGGTTYPSGNSWHLEIALDVETAHAICQNCKILLVEANSSSWSDLGAAENEAVALGANVVSNSWGGSEGSGETSLDGYFTHSGVAITASTGDNGYGTLYPAASPDVIAAGGTSLYLNADGSYNHEAAWSGGGSGCSSTEPKPSWQHDTGCSRRTIADVSADADPNTGVAVYDSVGTPANDAWYQVGGTSLASPIIASTYALTGTAQVNNASGLYANVAANPSWLHDVTTGSNGSCGATTYLCTAVAGFDGPTGLGTPNGINAFEPASATPDFGLSASPATVTVSAGGPSGTTTVGVAALGGFSDSVSLSASGLPTGVTASFGTNPATSSSVLTLTASSAAGSGTSTVTITGKSGSLTHTTTISLTVQTPSFTLSASPASQTVAPGSGTTYTVTVTPSGGFSGAVSLSTSGLPTGASAAIGSTTNGSTPVTITTSSTTPVGSYTITFIGTSTSPALTTTTTATLTVSAPGFMLSASPTSRTVTAGTRTTYTISIKKVNGFSGSVSFTTSALPSGVSVAFNPNPAGTSSVMTVTTGSSAAAGTDTIAVTGTSGSLTGSTNVTLVVQAARRHR
jgi:subtilase family serine protease